MAWKGKPTLDESLGRVTKFDNERKDAERVEGQVIPEPSSLALGEAREFELAIAHIDIDNFKGLSSSMKMKGLARFLSIYLTEMTYIVKEFGGDVESYSGDRVTALFGAGKGKAQAIEDCLNCGLTMLTVIQYVLNPYLARISLPSFRCAVGMEFGETWIERVGIKGENQLTLVGYPVNVASQLQELAKPSQILLAHGFYSGLSEGEKKHCQKMEPDKTWNWTYGEPRIPYPYYGYGGHWKDFPLEK